MNCSAYIALAALLLSPFVRCEEKPRTGRANRAPGVILFTLQEWDCPTIPGMERPCYGRSNIWLVNSDGSGFQALTHINVFQCGSEEPVWSPDGTHIAFNSTCARQDLSPGAHFTDFAAINQIWVMNNDGSDARPLEHRSGIGGSGSPAWSPDERKIAFSSSRPLDGTNVTVGNANIWVVNSDGSGAVPLTKLGRSIRYVGSGHVAWSPDGSKLAFVSDRALDGSAAQNQNEVPNIWVMNSDGSGVKPLTKLTAAHGAVFSPAWSPDSHTIGFSTNGALDTNAAIQPTSPRNIWIINADGSGLRSLTRVTDDPGVYSQPTWSPDGSKLAFVLKGDIWVMNADGSAAKPLTNLHSRHTTEISSPVWSPEGREIAFIYKSNVWVINADGSGVAQLTYAQGIRGSLSWRP